MGALYKFILYVRWPIVTGLLLALGLMVFFPELRPEGNGATNGVDDYPAFTGQEEGWQGVVSYAQAVNRAAPSVVNIYTRKKIIRRRNPLLDDPMLRRLFNIADIPIQQRMESALGSGVIVSEDGYLLTNNHVISGADEIVVALQDGRDAQAKLIGVNPESDLAVLKINLDNLNPIPIGSPETAQVGDVVLAIGNPFGMGQTVTQGIISATRRRGFNISRFENLIQTDAAINPGNSGGALIDAYGNLLGISVASYEQNGSNHGFGFAVPADTAIQTLKDIVNYGRVVHGWLGVEVETVSLSQQSVQALNLPSPNGLAITEVDDEGPADRAGLRPGDVIMRINNQIATQFIGGANVLWGEQLIAESRPGEKVKIDFIREGELQSLEAVVGSRPRAG